MSVRSLSKPFSKLLVAPRLSRASRRLVTTNQAPFAVRDDKKLVQWDLTPLPDPSRVIGTITLNSPETYNALTVEMGHEFSALCREVSHNTDLVAVILRGGGNKAFSTGGNFEWLNSLSNNSVHANADAMLKFYKSFLCVREIPVPVIAALQGPAVGAGAGLALACDLRTAVPHKVILGLNFTRLGIHAGMGTSHLLTRALGGPSAIINELLLTGHMLSGEECLKHGLINKLADNAEQAAMTLATEIGSKHPVAVRTMLQTLRQQQDIGLEQALHREAFAQAVCYARGDWGRGVEAVAKKQTAVFDPYHHH